MVHLYALLTKKHSLNTDDLTDSSKLEDAIKNSANDNADKVVQDTAGDEEDDYEEYEYEYPTFNYSYEDEKKETTTKKPKPKEEEEEEDKVRITCYMYCT